MALPTNNITTTLVKNTLKVNTNDVGALCKSTKINEWSKWKPIASNIASLTEEELINKNYGITTIKANTPLLLLSAIEENNNVGYKYNKPNGGNISPYRMGDFRNYNHNAQLPIIPFYNDGDVENIGNVSNNYTKSIYTLNNLGDDYSIGVNDLYPNMNRGIALYDEDNNNMLWSTTTIPYGKLGWQNMSGKEIKVIEFFTNVPPNKDTTTYIATSDDVFCAIPQPICTITLNKNTTANDSDLTNHDVWVNGTFVMSEDNSVCTYRFCFSSIGSNYIGGTLNNVVVKLSKDYNDSEVYSYINLGNITVGSEEESTLFVGTLSSKYDATTHTYPSINYIHIYWNNEKKYSKSVVKPFNGGGLFEEL